MSETNAEVDAIVTEAKSTFNLHDRLKGRDRNKKTVTVYTDEVTGTRHIEAEAKVDKLEATKAGVLTVDKSLWTAADEKRLKAAAKERDELEAELKKSAITLHLQSVPPVIARGGIRVARQTLGLKGETPADLAEEVDRLAFIYLLSQAVTKVIDGETGEEHSSLSFENARALKDWVHPLEQAKLDVALAEIQYRGTISASVTSDADF